MTHFVTYEPQNIGVDFVETACGTYTAISNFSVMPQCPECRPFARAHRALLARERLARLRRDRGPL